MARPKTPDGRRNPVSFKLTDAEQAQADSLRGETVLNVFMRQMALERMDQLQDSRIPESAAKQDSGMREPVTIAGTEIGITTDPRQPPGTAGLISRGRDSISVGAFSLGDEEPAPKAARKPAAKPRAASSPAKGKCEHRVSPGSYCARCKRLI